MDTLDALIAWFAGTGHSPGEVLSWCSQIAVAVVAVFAAAFAYNQIHTLKLLELLKYLEQQHVRDARRVVWKDIAKKAPGEIWWTDEQLEAQASIVCASFNTLGAALRESRTPKLRRFFCRHWGVTIVAQYRCLLPMIEHRRKTNGPEYMNNFEWLYKCAKRHAKHYLETTEAPISIKQDMSVQAPKNRPLAISN